MDDQKINKINGLSYEEELDVLEAVYKIGQEKGIELLRPDQMKKLVDGGRLMKVLPKDDKKKEKLVVNKDNIIKFINLVVQGLEMESERRVNESLEKINIINVPEETKRQMIFDRFMFDYGIDKNTLNSGLIERVVGEASNAK